MLATSHGNTEEGAHEKKSDEDNEYPDNKEIEGPSPIKVLRKQTISTRLVDVGEGCGM